MTQERRPCLVGLAGGELTGAERDSLARWAPVGVVLSSQNAHDLSQLSALIREVRELLGPDTWVVVTPEREGTAPLAGVCGAPPSQLSLGIAGDSDLTRRVFAAFARTLASVGVDMFLGPNANVVDGAVSTLGTQSFGRQPGPVTAQVMAAVSGLTEGGVQSAPGHWPTSPFDEVAATASREILASTHLPPFFGAVEAGAPAIVVSSGRALGLDPAGIPAWRSGPSLAGLRERARHQGWVLRDVPSGTEVIDEPSVQTDVFLLRSTVTELVALLPKVATRSMSVSSSVPAVADADQRRESAATIFREARLKGLAVLWPEQRNAPPWPPQDRNWVALDLRSTPTPGLWQPLASTWVAPASTASTPAELTGAAPGLVVLAPQAPNRSTAEALQEATGRLGTTWVALVGDTSLVEALHGDLGVILVPGADEADLAVLGEVLAGAMTVPAGPRWGD